MAVKFRFGWSRTVLAVYLLLLAVTYILMRKGVAGEVFTGIVFSWQLLVMFLGLARLSTKPVALGIVLVFLGAFTMLPLFTDVFPGLSGLVSDKSFWIVVPIFVAAVILGSEFLRIRRRVARKKLLPAVQSGLGEDGTLYEKTSFSSRHSIVEGGEVSGGTVSVIAGSMELDLSRCALAEGISVLEVNVTGGSLTVVMPRDWYMEMQVYCLFGKSKDRREALVRDVSKSLLIKGNVTLGKVIVKEQD